MKAHEVTQPGYYWYFGYQTAPIIVHVERWPAENPKQMIVTFIGDDMDENINRSPGDFVGPLIPPTL